MYLIPVVIIYAIIAYFIFYQLKYVRKFNNEKVTSSNNAKILSDIGLSDSAIFQSQVKKGIFVKVKENKFYMDEEKGTEYGKKRRGAFYSLTFLFIVIGFFVVNNF